MQIIQTNTLMPFLPNICLKHSTEFRELLAKNTGRTLSLKLTLLSVALSTHKKRRRRTKFCSQQRPIRGRIRIKNTTINHMIVSMHILGAHLCISGRIGLLWLSWCRFSSAALFCVLEHRLIVLNCIFSCCNCPMKLKLSHE